MKWTVLLMGLALTSVLQYLPLKDKHEPFDKGCAAQMAGMVIVALALLHRDRE